jgi:hypothetical protein
MKTIADQIERLPDVIPGDFGTRYWRDQESSGAATILEGGLYKVPRGLKGSTLHNRRGPRRLSTVVVQSSRIVATTEDLVHRLLSVVCGKAALSLLLELLSEPDIP